MKVAGQISAGTTYIELDDCKVPCDNLIGEEGKGMSYIMNNFNHERLFISIGVTRQARVALSSAFGYVLKREAFGKVRYPCLLVLRGVASDFERRMTPWQKADIRILERA
jgi:alkylation response protein AidB-like acyl-CoA dehydrogenase